MLWIALLAWAGLLVVLSAVHQKWAFVGSLVLVELAGGSSDTAMNAEATQRFSGKPSALLRFHALFNCGAIMGAAVAGVVLHAGVSWRWIWPGVAAVALAVGLWTLSLGPEPAPDPSSSARVAAQGNPLRRIRRDGLLLLLVTFALAEVTEGGVDTGGVLYLRNRLATGVLLESLSPIFGLAALGLALGAGGASLFWPLIMSNVSRLASQVVSAVGTLTAAGYIGWVAGAPVVGWVSQAFGPQHGRQVLAVAALAVAVVSVLGRKREARELTGRTSVVPEP